jgi:hypothetical protein
MIFVLRAGLIFAFFIFGGGAVIDSRQDEAKERLSSFLPRDVQGWTSAADGDLYDAETIFDYIDGAGEVYRAFHLKNLLSRRYTKTGAPDIIVDFFDMGSSADAFGVFTHDLEGENPAIGQGGNYKDGLLSFWRDRYFVSVSADRETGDARKAVLEFGRRIAGFIGRDGPKPALLRLLPLEFANDRTVRFFHNPVIMNYHFFVSRDNILDLDSSVDAVMSSLGEKGEGGRLLIIRYPSAARASAALRSFSKAYLPGAREPGPVQTGDHKWTTATVRDDTAAIVFGAPTAAAATSVISKVFR